MKISVIGAGHLGKIHINCIKQIKEFELVGFYDSNAETAKKVSKDMNVKAFDNVEELINASDAIDVVTPTSTHFHYASMAIKQSKHVFIEKPISSNTKEAQKLIELSTEADIKVQIGHVERFNPAFRAAQKLIDNPLFIEAHRLAQYNPRGCDVPVVMDLMIHDIDIVLSIIKSGIKKISASGTQVVSDTIDIANARLEFDNGAVANLTSSRISINNLRKMRVFQKNAYFSIDFLNKETTIANLQNGNKSSSEKDIIIDVGEGKSPQSIHVENLEIESINAIKTELKCFYDAIIANESPLVSVHDGTYALSVGEQIMAKIT